MIKFPNKKTIIIITGGPGTGKTGTADRLLNYIDDQDIVRVSYDEVKEKNWDRFGFDNEKQKDELNAWSLTEFYLILQNYMWKQEMILTEYPFYQRHKGKLKELIDTYNYDAVTVFLFADKKTVYARAINRDETEVRHPGHLLHEYHRETYDPQMLKSEQRIKPSFDEFFKQIEHKQYNVDLGTVISLDVTDFSKISYQDICNRMTAGK